MITHILLTLAAASLALTAAAFDPPAVVGAGEIGRDETFDRFLTKYNKTYQDPVEYGRRLHIFRKNMLIIARQNLDADYKKSGGGGADVGSAAAVFGVNQFSDLTPQEVLGSSTGFFSAAAANALGYSQCTTIEVRGPTPPMPPRFDWRDQNKVTFVKQQGVCGSCWAFVAMGILESQYAIKHDQLINLSEQQLLDCDQVDMGCNGGMIHMALQELIQMGGVMNETDYPYEGVEYMCHVDSRRYVAAVDQCFRYDLRDEDKLKQVLHTVGPIGLAIDASDIINYLYGIMNWCQLSELNHAVLLVGYGIENGVPYWIFKNSWGTEWGEQGYFRARRGINACGMMNPYAASAKIK
jgi:cathepsin F